MRRAFRYFAVAALGLVVIGAAGVAGLLLFGPAYIERSVVPGIGRRLGLDDLHFDIRRIGLKGTEINSLRIGNRDRPALVVGPVIIDYSPGGLLQARVDRVSVSGAEVFCGYRDGAFYLRGIEIRDVLSQFRSEGEETPPDAPRPPILRVGRLCVDHGVAVFFHDGKTYRLPFDVSLEADPDIPESVHGAMTLYPRGESVTVSGEINLKTQSARAKIEGKGIETARFSDLMDPVPDLRLSGLLDLLGHGGFHLDPPAVGAASATLSFRSRDTGYGGVSLRAFDPAAEPLTVSLNWKAAPPFRISLPPILLDGPVPLEMTGVQAVARRKKSGIVLEGSGTLNLPKTPKGGKALFAVADPLSLPLLFGMDWHREKQQWRFFVTRDKKEGQPATIPLEIAAADGKMALNVADADVHGVVEDKAASIEYRLSADDLSVSAEGVLATFSEAAVQGTARRGEDGGVSAEGTASISGGTIEALQKKIRLKRAGARLPLRWPAGETKGPEGGISIGSILWDGRNLGALEGSLRQVSDGLTLSAEHWNLLLSGMGVWISGDFPVLSQKRSESRIDLSASWPESSPDLALGRFSPSAKGVKINGGVAAEGHLRFGGAAGASGTLKISIENGWLRKEEQEIAVEGIDGSVRLPHLPGIQSAPAQRLTIRKAAFGQVALTDASIAFQIEPAGSLLIEQSRFRWAGGRVSGHAVRIAPGTDVYDVVLYCDRLSLAQVLQQFGAVDAEGEGTVNGRVPIRLASGELTFDDGFLYSTPGEGGSIHVTGAESLTAGIPEETQQFNQIDLAREAMKDYRYEWAKLRLNTEGEDLIMALHLNGKPMDPLPFVYKKEAGGFVRIEDGQVGSRFQGIRLDVNFRLPLNRILQYKRLFY